jgi:hypothetical protein
MEIDANLNTGPLNGLVPSARPLAPGAQSIAGTDSFANSTAGLEDALQNTPEIRPEAVARGMQLASQDGYPSDDEIKSLSNFLANKLQSNSD